MSQTDGSLRIFPEKRIIPKKKYKTMILFPEELVFKQSEPFEVKERESLLLIKGHLEKFTNPYAAISHGKDSLVMADLICRTARELRVKLPEFWLNDTLNTYNEEKPFWDVANKWLGIEDNFRVFTPPKLPNGKQATVWSVADMVGHLPTFRSTAKHRKNSYKRTNVPECCHWLKHKSVDEFLKELKPEERYDCCFVGTRAKESSIRWLVLLQRCRSYLKKSRIPYPIRTVTPLSFWLKSDIYEYFARYKLPQNPTYQVHNIERMGCASCPAYKGWEIDQAQDPTPQRIGQLRQNLLFLKKTDTKRFEDAIKNLSNYKGKLNPKAYDIIKEFSYQKSIV